MGMQTSVQTPIAHLVGPGRLKVLNRQLAFAGVEKSPVRLMIPGLESIYCYGSVGLTDDAVAMLFRHRIPIVWLTAQGGRCVGRLLMDDSSAATLRLCQLEVLHRREAELALARDWVIRKVESQLEAIRHFQRHGMADVGAALTTLRSVRKRAESAGSRPTLRGLEGQAAIVWYGVFARRLRSPWRFDRRSRRPPRDAVNALLSLGYTLLLGRVVAGCQAAGLEIQRGALHDFRPGRPSLACDVMEPYRVPAVDRWVLTILASDRWQPSDFVETPTQGVRVNPDRFGELLHSWVSWWHTGPLESLLQQTIRGLCQEFRKKSTYQLDNPADPPDTIIEM